MNVADGPAPGIAERKRLRTRQTLIDAAVELCVRVGYEKATIPQIAALADVSSRTFHRHFVTKDAAFLGVLDTVSHAIVAELSVQPNHLGPLEALRAAHVAVFSRVADRPYGRPSADQVVRILRVVGSSDALRLVAIEYRKDRLVEGLARRAGVSLQDRRIQLAATVFNAILFDACAHLVATTDEALLGPRAVVDMVEEAFTQFAAFSEGFNSTAPVCGSDRAHSPRCI